jgi:very-short-patch-repair endonuclease
LSVRKAREFRKTMTPPERRLWNTLKTRPEGLKFRKQHEHGPYSLDFFCYEAAVAIEVDGVAHELGANPQRDVRRDAWLASRGIQTIRVAATDVRDNLEGVVTYIADARLKRVGR